MLVLGIDTVCSQFCQFFTTWPSSPLSTRLSDRVEHQYFFPIFVISQLPEHWHLAVYKALKIFVSVSCLGTAPGPLNFSKMSKNRYCWTKTFFWILISIKFCFWIWKTPNCYNMAIQHYIKTWQYLIFLSSLSTAPGPTWPNALANS